MELIKAEQLAKELISKHCPDYSFDFVKSAKYLGQCRYNEKQIVLSIHWTLKNKDEQVKDTILHEIAHALTNSGHDLFWAKKAEELGAKPTACFFQFDDFKVPEKEKFIKYFCEFCKSDKLVEKEISGLLGKNLFRLECKHVIKANPIVIEKEKLKWEIKSKDGKEPYPFQYEGIDFVAEAGFNALIADEQGLGKTIQGIGALLKYKEELLPALLIVKASLKRQWAWQLLNWGGKDFMPQVIESSDVPPVDGFDCYIATYDILRRFGTNEIETFTNAWGNEETDYVRRSPFYDYPFKTVILDEVQAIKGNSKRANEVKAICKGKNVIALSGTPIKNNALEYYTILNMLSPEKFPSMKQYINRWVDYEQTRGGQIKYKGLRNPEAFKQYTKDFIIRRTRKEKGNEIGLTVTEARRLFHHVDFENAKTKAAYDAAENEFVKQMEQDARKDPTTIIGLLSVMRHIVGISKIPSTVELSTNFLLEQTGKLIIMAHHKDVQDAEFLLIKKWCRDGGYADPMQFHSGLSSDERFKLINDFEKNDSRILVASTLAMMEGVDGLQHVSSQMIFSERQWNPSNEEQAESRLVRIGQVDPFVDATYMTVSNTIDEYFADIVERKRSYMKQTLDGRMATWDELSLLTELYDVIKSKGRKKAWSIF